MRAVAALAVAVRSKPSFCTCTFWVLFNPVSHTVAMLLVVRILLTIRGLGSTLFQRIYLRSYINCDVDVVCKVMSNVALNVLIW